MRDTLDTALPAFLVRDAPHRGETLNHPGDNLGANLSSVSHICHLWEVIFERELTKETIYLPLGCL